jgi:hypothetical protein
MSQTRTFPYVLRRFLYFKTTVKYNLMLEVNEAWALQRGLLWRAFSCNSFYIN